MFNHKISMFFGFIVIVGMVLGIAGSYAASLGPCMGDEECIAEGNNNPDASFRIVLAQR